MPQDLFATPHVDWQAVWIWHENDQRRINSYFHFRKIFDVEAIPEASMLHITADTKYMVWINGKEVGRGPIFCDPRWQSYDSYDVGKLLQPGKNVIAILCYYYGEGITDEPDRRNQPRLHQNSRRTIHDSMPGVLCQLEMFADDQKTLIVSDKSWKSHPADCWHTDVVKICDTAYSELYYAEKEIDNWQNPSLDDSRWDGVVVRAGMIGAMLGGVERIHERVFPWCVLEPRSVPHLVKRQIALNAVLTVGEVIETEPWANENVALRMALENIVPSQFTSVHTHESLAADQKTEVVPFDNNTSYADFRGIRSATVLLDVGEIINGRIRFDVDCSSGAIIDIAYGQRLLETGKPEIYSSRISSADRYVAREGRQQWTSFAYRHFRYVQLTFRNLERPLAIHDLQAVAVENAAPQRGDFECSDDAVNWAWQAGVRSARLNLHEQCECCHNRERAPLGYDVVYNIPGVMAAFGDVPAVRRYIRSMLRAQTVYGFLTHTPARTYEYGMLLAGCGEGLIDVLWKHYERFGNRALLEEAYLPVRRHLEFHEQYRGEDGLICDQPMLVFQDWAEIEGDGRGKVLTLNARYARGLQLAHEIARAVSDDKMAQKWLQQFKQTLGSINEKFWADEKGAFVDYISPEDCRADHTSEHGNYMLMAWDYVAEGRAHRIVEHLKDPTLEAGRVTPLQMNFLIDGLFSYGHAQYALEVIRERYGWMKEAGLDGIAETWSLYGSRVWARRGWQMMMSRTVALLTGPVHGMLRYVLGVESVAPGSQRVTIQPQPGDLAWARGSVPTGKGDVRVSWKRDGQLFKMDCDLPASVEGTVVIPFQTREVGRVTLNGEEVSPSDFDETGRPVLSVSGRFNLEATLQIEKKTL